MYSSSSVGRTDAAYVEETSVLVPKQSLNVKAMVFLHVLLDPTRGLYVSKFRDGSTHLKMESVR